MDERHFVWVNEGKRRHAVCIDAIVAIEEDEGGNAVIRLADHTVTKASTKPQEVVRAVEVCFAARDRAAETVVAVKCVAAALTQIGVDVEMVRKRFTEPSLLDRK